MAAKILASAGIALALGACAFEPLMTAKIVDYNRVAEDVGNSLLLLNVLRAKDRKPLYFTHLSAINPSINSSVGLNATIPFSPISYTTLSLNPSGRLDSSNQGTVGIEAGKEFMRGITTPITMATFEYFWERGWPHSILLNMFVQKIEVAYVNAKGEPDSTRPVRVYFNSPSAVGRSIQSNDLAATCHQNEHVLGEGRAQFACFQHLLRLLEPVLRMSTRTSVQPITPKVGANAAALRDWRALVEAAKGEYKLDSTGGAFQLLKNSESKRFCIVNPKQEKDPSSHRRSSTFGCEPMPPPARQAARRARLELQAITVGPPRAAQPVQRKTPDPEPQGPAAVRARTAYASLDKLCGDQQCVFFFHLRSPESMLYYLGEIARAHIESSREFNVLVFDKAYSQDDKIPESLECTKAELDGQYFLSLFQVVAGSTAASISSASVSYEGRQYHIPTSKCHASMQALTLVSQLIALQRDSKELPVTTNVRVIGP